MKKKNVIAVIVILLIIAAVSGGYYYIWGRAKADPADLYQTHTAVRENVSRMVSGTGYVEVKDKVSVYLSASQTVSKVNVKEGDKVEAGDVLVVYDIEGDMADLNRRLSEAEIQLANAKLNLKGIEQSATGNELVQYYSDITTAGKNVTDAQNDIITAQKNVSDAKADITAIEIKAAQQQLLLDNLSDSLERNEALLESGLIPVNTYDDLITQYKSAQETMNEILLQKETREKTLETRLQQEQYAKQKLETRLVQEEYAKQKLDNALNRFSDESTAIQYSLQKNIISLNEITIEQIKADMAKLKENSSSPIAGNITAINAQEGAVISKSVPVAAISDTSSIIIRFETSEYDAPAIELGQKVYIQTSALPDKVYTGVVTKIAEEAVEKEDSSDNEIVVPVEISILDLDGKLKIGYSVDVDIVIQEKQGSISVPAKALARQGEGYYLYVIKDGEVIKTVVEIGLWGDKAVEILSGISEGDLIVLEPETVAE